MNIYASACYKHCWKDLHLILNTQVRIITKIMEDSLSFSQQEEHHYFIHLWACRCTDTRQIIFLINQCSTLDITQKLKGAHCSQRHSGGTGGGRAVPPSPVCCMQQPPTFAIPLNRKTMQWKHREEKQVFKHATIITTYKIREIDDGLSHGVSQVSLFGWESVGGNWKLDLLLSLVAEDTMAWKP